MAAAPMNEEPFLYLVQDRAMTQGEIEEAVLTARELHERARLHNALRTYRRRQRLRLIRIGLLILIAYGVLFQIGVWLGVFLVR